MELTLQNGASVEETLVLTFFDLANQLSKLGEEVAAGAALTGGATGWAGLPRRLHEPSAVRVPHGRPPGG